MHKYALRIENGEGYSLLSVADVYGDDFPDQSPALYNTYIEAHTVSMGLFERHSLTVGSIDIVTLEVSE